MNYSLPNRTQKPPFRESSASHTGKYTSKIKRDIQVNVTFCNTTQYDFSKLQSWEDPDLSWDTSVYHHDMVVLPVSKIWTPELHVTNG